MKYRPLSEEALETRTDEKISELTDDIQALDLPIEIEEALLEALTYEVVDTVINREHYESYEDYCESLADEARHGL